MTICGLNALEMPCEGSRPELVPRALAQRRHAHLRVAAVVLRPHEHSVCVCSSNAAFRPRFTEEESVPGMIPEVIVPSWACETHSSTVFSGDCAWLSTAEVHGAAGGDRVERAVRR
jgi:hypothetical protein